MHNTYNRILTTGFVLREDTPCMILAEDFTTKHNLGFEVYRVDGFQTLYSTYLSNPTHENFMLLVDLVSRIIGNLSVEEFFIKGQANNSTVTPLTLCFIEDILSGDYYKTHLKYAVATSGLKMCILSNPTQGPKSEKKLKEAWVKGGNRSMTHILSEIITDKEVFMSFLRYVFND